MAAINIAFLGILKTGDHVLVCDGVYGPVRNLDRALLKGLGISVTYFAAQDDLDALITPETKMIYVESPGSLLFEMLDLPAMAAIAKQRGVLLAADNTWGSGYIYRPLALGADISVVAGTKYVAGHSDVMLGAVVAKDEAVAARLHSAQYAMGNSISADDAWLALRGVKTMAVRMPQHAINAMKVCEFFDAQPYVAKIFHPAWHKDAGYALWQRDCTGSNGCCPSSSSAHRTQQRLTSMHSRFMELVFRGEAMKAWCNGLIQARWLRTVTGNTALTPYYAFISGLRTLMT
jgi:cystathionine beta-lyase